MNEASQQPPGLGFMATEKFRAVCRKSSAIHSVLDWATPEDYLLNRRMELQKQMSEKVLLYLDTNHWANLRKTRSGNALPGYSEMLRLLENLRLDGRICCPVSSSVFDELMTQEPLLTRLAAASLMDQLSGGVCLLDPVEMIRAEWRQHCFRVLLGDALPQVVMVPWTKAGFWIGEFLPVLDYLPPAEQAINQKVVVDIKWEMGFQEVIEYVGSQGRPTRFAVRFAAVANAAAADARLHRMTFPELLRHTKRDLLNGEGVAGLLDGIGSTIFTDPAQADAAFTTFVKFEEERDPSIAPSMQVLTGLHAAATFLHRKEFQPNDMMDFGHAAVAVPYCDGFFCDAGTEALLRNKPLEFGKVYDTVILSRPAEIVAYLKTLTGLVPGSCNVT